MNRPARRALALARASIILGTVTVLGVVAFAIHDKERVKRDGDVVFLELAPVDPRSLIQGDYMALRFALARDLDASIRSGNRALREGEVALAPVAVDGRRVARLAPGDSAATIRLRYRIRHAQVWLGTNAFFFEEGTARRYDGARYGEFRVDRATGEAVLVGLRGAGLETL